MASRRTWASILQGGIRRIRSAAAVSPGIRHVLKAAHEAEFAQGRPPNALRGVYADFAEAARAAPRSRPLGYDRPEMAGLYRGGLDRLNPHDYPVLFWMRHAIEHASRVFDFGGHVGVSYYGYEHYLNYPDTLTWTVYDVPAVTRDGTELAHRNGQPRLRFTTQIKDADGADILLAAGSLQYVEDGFLHRALAELRDKPRHIIIQRIPLHDHRSFVTLQATGPAFCPYNVAHRQTFIADLTAIGYELVDSWTCDRSLEIPFHPECHVPNYSGLYLKRID